MKTLISLRRFTKPRITQLLAAVLLLSVPILFMNCGQAFTPGEYNVGGFAELSQISVRLDAPTTLPSKGFRVSSLPKSGRGSSPSFARCTLTSGYSGRDSSSGVACVSIVPY
jgi:hypothetical protein